MPANLATFEDGRYRMAAWGRIPVWHGDGQRTDELMTPEQALKLGGLDYEVETFPNEYVGPDGLRRDGQGVQIVRTDTMQVLAQASESYTQIQNRDMVELLRPFIDDGSVHGIMTAGALGDGERSWVQAVIGDFGVDTVDRGLSTLLFQNSFDTTMALRCGYSGTWVVCGNTWTMASKEFDSRDDNFSIIHSGNVEEEMKKVETRIHIANRTVRSQEEIATLLSKVKVSDPREVWRMAVACMPPSKNTLTTWKEKGSASGYWVNEWHKVVNEYNRGPGMDLDSRRGTAFGAWNAITGYVDYRRWPNATESQQARHSMFGSGADIKSKALDVSIDHFLFDNDWSEEVKEVETLCSR